MEDLDSQIIKIMVQNPVFLNDFKSILKKNNMRFEIENGQTYFRLCSGIRYKREIEFNDGGAKIIWNPELNDSFELKELLNEGNNE